MAQYTVGSEDIDELLHTNNTVYVKWCERTAWAHSNALGMDIRKYRQLDRAMAIRHSEYDYELATGLEDELCVGTWILNWDKRMRMIRRFQIIRLADRKTVLRGIMQFVCIELSSGRARRMPADFIEGYGPAVLDIATPDRSLR